jgi:radical SAM-linked protein
MIRFAVEGDVRFLSHHDGLRAVERLCARAPLPLSYTQGFNPHPKISLALPRPVGVSSRDELLVLSLDEPIEAGEILARLNRHAPRGLRFYEALPAASRPPRPLRATYELDVPADRRDNVARRVSELRTQDSWPVQRMTSLPHGRGFAPRNMDLRPLVEDIAFAGQKLTMVLVRRKDAWARPGEILALCGLDGRLDLASLTRTRVELEEPAPTSPGGPAEAHSPADADGLDATTIEEPLADDGGLKQYP